MIYDNGQLYNVKKKVKIMMNNCYIMYIILNMKKINFPKPWPIDININIIMLVLNG